MQSIVKWLAQAVKNYKTVIKPLKKEQFFKKKLAITLVMAIMQAA